MATTPNKQNFIQRSRKLAADFIVSSDSFAALAAELTYSGYADPEDPNVLTPEDFAANIGLTSEQLVAFFTVMQTLLAPLTVEQKKTIYAVKGGGFTPLF